ncbi:MAG: ABC transporter ATP-binding protein [Planctomycetes bacterium]|nr:ABC transporter ATP-binding protein [Planctomycetota bacterium]
MSEPVLRTEKLCKTYRMGRVEVPVLKGIDLTVEKGSFTLIVGHSGCGKSTLLHVLSLLDRPTSGSVLVDGCDAFAKSSRWRERLRNRRIGFVFQFYHLLPELTVLGNVLLPELIGHGPLGWLRARGAARERAVRMLETVGMENRIGFKPNRLSGGERQRAAIARALVHDPEIVFADEPTGNLDTDAGWQVFEMLRSLAINRGKTVVMVTHDNRFIPEAQQVLYLEDGRIVDAETARRLALKHERKGLL